ncbi:MAG TPA: alpha/beta hydrolase [Flavitalea sp.]|nr:alpha/beta hydrolase [Flavitalea sp.]
MRYLLYLAFGLVVLFSSCKKSDIGSKKQDSQNDSLRAVNYIDVSYGSDAKQKLDVYLPALRNETTRLVIIIHGGGWNSGDKSDFNNYITEFQNRLQGYAFANLNYRLVTTSSNYFPTQENDINAAITFLKSKAADYNISENFIYVGISAGAHLALLQGYKHNDVLQPKGIVSFFGPVDLQRLYVNSDSTIPGQLKFIMNATLEGNPNIFYSSSPINYISSNTAPTLMLHGDQDRLVPIEQAYMLQARLEENGVFNKLIIYPGQEHGWIGKDLEDSFQQVTSFIKGLAN